MSDEYELLPVEELEKLRREVDELKAHPLGDSSQGNDLLHAVEQLTISINKLLKAFSDADATIAKEYVDMKTVQEHLGELHDENEKIANGIVSVASLLGGLDSEDKQQPQQQYMPPQQPSFAQPSVPPMQPSPQQQQAPQAMPPPQQPQEDPFAAPPAGAVNDLLGDMNDDPFAPKADDPFASPVKQPDFQEPAHHPAMPPPPPPPRKKRGLF